MKYIIACCIAILIMFVQQVVHANGENLLIDAINKHDVERVQKLLNTGINANFKVGQLQQSPLHYAITRKKVGLQLVKLLIAFGADANALDSQGRPPLFLAALYGCDSIAEYFIEMKAKIDIVDSYGMNALHYALKETECEMLVEISKSRVARLLMENGINVSQRNYEGNTPRDLVINTDRDVFFADFFEYGLETEPEIFIMEFIDGESNVREGPGTNQKILFQPKNRTQCLLISDHDPWLEVKFRNGQTGWVHKKNLRFAADEDELPMNESGPLLHAQVKSDSNQQATQQAPPPKPILEKNGKPNQQTKKSEASTFDLIVFIIALIIGIKILNIIRRSPFFKIFLFLLKIVGLNAVAELLRYDGDSSVNSNSPPSNKSKSDSSTCFSNTWRCCATCSRWSGSRSVDYMGNVAIENKNLTGKCGSTKGSCRGFPTYPDQGCDDYLKWSHLK